MFRVKFVLAFTFIFLVSSSSANQLLEDLARRVTALEQTVQDPNKPSAHIEAANLLETTYPSNAVIKDWSVSAPHSHLAGGMTYHDGKLTVPTAGRYYIYAQLYYHNPGRVYFSVNGATITMIQPLGGQSTWNAGGVFNLMAGDVIALTVWPTHSPTIYMATQHSYFGAFLI